jgi:hypothetical protein
MTEEVLSLTVAAAWGALSAAGGGEAVGPD